MQLSKPGHVTSVTYLPVGKLVSTHQPGAQNVLASLAARNFVARSNCSLLSQHEACCSTGSLQLRSLAAACIAHCVAHYVTLLPYGRNSLHCASLCCFAFMMSTAYFLT